MRNAQKTFISVLLLFALSLSASAAVTWTTATDAGYYDIDGEKHGLIRYLFHAETDGEVTESGIKFVTSETDDTQVGEILKGKPANIILVNGEYKTATNQGSMDFLSIR